jgi:hypothetical protein
VTHVWKEKTAQRAFLLGLALPYVLAGLLADVSGGVRVMRAHAAGAWLQAFDAVPLKVEVRDAETGNVIADARTQGGAYGRHRDYPCRRVDVRDVQSPARELQGHGIGARLSEAERGR